VDSKTSKIIKTIDTDVELYSNFIRDRKNDDWLVYPMTLTHYSESYVETYKVKKDTGGYILKIRCPPCKNMISICGVDNSGVDPIDFAKTPYLYTIPHEFSVSCYDKDNNELPFDTLLSFVYDRPSDVVWPLDTVLYRDVSLKIGERYKRKDERYYFPRGRILFGGDLLYLQVIKSSIDIDRVELFMKCDYLTK
jgi:hypothetical protein